MVDPAVAKIVYRLSAVFKWRRTKLNAALRSGLKKSDNKNVDVDPCSRPLLNSMDKPQRCWRGGPVSGMGQHMTPKPISACPSLTKWFCFKLSVVLDFPQATW